MKKIKQLSVAIITLNEANNLPECLQSVSFAAEVVLVDSGSQDETVQIALAQGCKVIKQTWMGFSRQKQFAVDNCSNDWVLILDADERIPAETGDKIRALLEKDTEDETIAYSFLRKNFFHGRWIKHSGWWPERVIRLVNRHYGAFNDTLVHEKWIPEGSMKQLDSCIEHYSFNGYSELIDKMQYYTTLAARHLFEKGKRCHWWTPVSHGLWTLCTSYFYRFGFLDGFDGLVISLLNGAGSFMKYAKLKELQLSEEN